MILKVVVKGWAVQKNGRTNLNDVYVVWGVFAQAVVFWGSRLLHRCWNF